MPSFFSLPRWSVWLAFCLLPVWTAGQTTKSPGEAGASEPKGIVETVAASAQGEREHQFARALARYLKEDYAGSRQVLDSLAHTSDGELIVDSLSGLAYHMAGMSYYQVYDDANAIPMYKKAISIRDALYPGPHIHRAHTRYNLANSMHWIGRPDTATVLLRDAIAIYDGISVATDTTNWLRSLKLLGVIGRESNDRELVRSATVAMTALMADFVQITDIDRHQMAYDAVKHYQYLGEYDKAESFVADAIAGAEAIGEQGMAADVVSTRGNLYFERGDMARARTYYHRALAMLNSVESDPSSKNIVYANLSATYVEEQNYAEALRFYETASNYPESETTPFSKAQTAIERAEVFGHLGRASEAMMEYEESLSAIAGTGGVEMRNGRTYMIPDSVKSVEVALAAHASRAQYLLSQGETDAALSDLEEVFTYQDMARAKLNSEGSRYALSETGWQYYDLAVQLYYQAAQSAAGGEARTWRAFALAERAKAYSQLASLRQTRRAADRREQDLRYSLAELERQKLTDPTLESPYANQQLRLELHLRSQPESPDIVSATLDRTVTLDFLAAQGLSVLEYHVGEDRSFGFYLSESGAIHTWELPGAATIQNQVEAYRRAIIEGVYREKSLRPTAEQGRLDQNFVAAGATLAEWLVPSHIELGDRVAVVPDGALNYLPFTALFATAPTVPLDYSAIDYQRDGREVFTTFSLRYLMELEAVKRPEFEENLLAFAPSYGGEASPNELSAIRSARLTRSPVKAAGESLPGLLPLRHNRAEVVAITDALPRSTALLDGKAKLAEFVNSVGGASILHVAGHGLVDPNIPSLSFLAFTQEGDKIEDEELLYFNDLQALAVDADLVVLSACETSLGKIAPGEAVLSLGNAFASAGARSTLTSLWKVDDAATELFMLQFYTSLGAGQSRAAALAEAQRHLREETEYAHPYYWAGFSLNGQAGPLELKRAGVASWVWPAVGAATILLMLAGLYSVLSGVRKSGTTTG